MQVTPSGSAVYGTAFGRPGFTDSSFMTVRYAALGKSIDALSGPAPKARLYSTP
ncbi:hypothetical protein M2271_001473 [Streptomyces sp. LBL]|nr:hypothetical protein [Streptomyces sp. LBL]